MVHSFGSTADFVIKKGTFGIFTGFGHFQTSEKSGRNIAVEFVGIFMEISIDLSKKETKLNIMQK
jgi:hypothetical protein